MNIVRAGRLSRCAGAMAAALACVFVISGDGTAGIQGSGFRSAVVRGPISQFGSIFVNGTEYDVSAANIQLDGVPGSDSQLRIGQVVTVRADINSDGTAGIATNVSFSSDVLGPVAQVDLAGGSLVILGQRIRLLSDTLLDPQLPLGGILGLVPGIRLQVSGAPNAAGDIVASRIDLVLGGPPTARIQGVVQALNTGAHTFRVNAQTVSYGATTPVGTLANGSTVAVQGTVPLGQSSLQASSVEVVSGLGGAADQGGDIQGLVTAFSSASDFAVGPQRIATDAGTHFDLNGQVLGPNLAVEVWGYFNADGVLVAREVEATASGLVGALGVVQAVADHSVRVLGVNFTLSDDTAFADESAAGVRPFGRNEIHVGDYVEIRGAAPDLTGAVKATVLRRDDARSDLYLEGTALNLLLPGLRVLGVPVITTPQTHFPGGGLLAQLKFFLQAPNHIVRVRGVQSGSTLVADQVEIVK